MSIISLLSCNSVKYISDGQYLLDKVSIHCDHPDYGSTELLPIVKQVPNFKMFSLNKTQLQVYNLSGRDTTRWINRQLKKLGEPPVVFDSTLVYITNRDFEKFFINMGYMHVDVKSQVTLTGKKAKVVYTIKTNEPYRINSYRVDSYDLGIEEELKNPSIPLRRMNGEPASVRTSLIRDNMLFNRNVLDKERDRITTFLQNRGYYAFNKDYIRYEADSSFLTNAIQLEMKILSYPEILPSGQYEEVPHRKYFINKTFLFIDYNPLRISNISDYLADDSVQLNNYTIYYQGKRPNVRPGTLLQHNYISQGRPYSLAREEITYASLASLSALNHIQIRYEEFLKNDSAFLNAYILTSPAKKQTVTFSVEGTNTAYDLGLATSMNYNHRNLFRGSENLSLKIRGAYETISNNLISKYFLNLGAEVAIRFPKFMFPFLNNSFKRENRASTEFSLVYNNQTRPEYDRILLAGGLNYIWQNQGLKTSQHQFKLLDINYLTFPKIDSLFRSKLPSNAQLFSFTEQFIAGLNYSYSYSTLNPMQKQKDVESFRMSIESAGNILYGFSYLFDAKKDINSPYKLFNTPYFQFLKGNFEYANTRFIDKHNSIAYRFGFGIGFPYGNSNVLPFEKRFYSGGASGVRAWAVRTLGPGSYRPSSNTTFYEQSGDIRLDVNLEYRTHFFWKIEAAAFIDAGNIWTIRNYDGQEGGVFKFNSFYEQIALGYGLGLRLDFDYFLIRLDGGWKMYDPEKSKNDRWAVFHPNFTNNFAWHFAVGYPF